MVVTPEVAPVDLIQWVERLSRVSFGTLVAVILLGNFYGWWVWGKYHRERVAEITKRHDERVAELAGLLEERKASETRWQDMALGLLTPLEQVTTDHLSRKRG